MASFFQLKQSAQVMAFHNIAIHQCRFFERKVGDALAQALVRAQARQPGTSSSVSWVSSK